MGAHQKAHEGIPIPYIAKTGYIRKNNDSYVDDTDDQAAVEGENYHTSKIQNVAHLDQGEKLWAALINATRGAVAHHKSFWKMLAWTDVGFLPQLKGTSSLDVVLDNGCRAAAKVVKLKSTDPNKGLGVLQSLSGQQDAEFAHRLKQTRDIAQWTAPASMPVTYAYNLLNGRIIPTKTYSFSVMMFSAEKCRKLNGALDTIMLKKL